MTDTAGDPSARRDGRNTSDRAPQSSRTVNSPADTRKRLDAQLFCERHRYPTAEASKSMRLRELHRAEKAQHAQSRRRVHRRAKSPIGGSG